MAINVAKDCPAALIQTLLAQYNALQADVTSLRTSLNAHTHTENTAEAYTQNATTGAGPSLASITSQQVVAH